MSFLLRIQKLKFIHRYLQADRQAAGHAGSHRPGLLTPLISYVLPGPQRPRLYGPGFVCLFLKMIRNCMNQGQAGCLARSGAWINFCAFFFFAPP